MSRTASIRFDDDVIEGLDKLAKIEAKRTKYPVSRNALVMRACRELVEKEEGSAE